MLDQAGFLTWERVRSRTLFFVFFAHAIYYLRSFSFSFSLPRRNLDPGSLSRLFSPLRAFVFIARRGQPFFPPSTRVELTLSINGSRISYIPVNVGLPLFFIVVRCPVRCLRFSTLSACVETHWFRFHRIWLRLRRVYMHIFYRM